MIKYSKKIVKAFNKRLGIFTYSGTLALEIALKTINVNQKKVLIPYNACYRVLTAVLNSGGIPVIVKPANSVYVTPEDIDQCLKQVSNIVAIVLVYQFGIQLDIKAIYNVVKKYNCIKIIEDVAQFWGNSVGLYGDFVVTSLGHSKPLCNDFGGLIASNSDDFLEILDITTKTSRQKNGICYSYALDANVKINEKSIIKKANINIKIQKKKAKTVFTLLHKKFSSIETINIESVFHRLPIFIDTIENYNKVIDYLQENKIKYELPFKDEMQNLPVLKHYKYDYIDLSKQHRLIIFIRTRDY